MSANTERLDAIQARVDAVTPGPWEWDGGNATIVALRGVFNESLLLFQPHEDHIDGYGYPSEDCVADAEFIAAAPSDVAFLLDLARKQGAVIAALSQWAGRAKTGYYDEAQDDVVQIIRPALWPTP